MFILWRNWRENRRQARQLVEDALAEARAPHWYTDYAVPDSFDGRFEMAVLCLFCRLYQSPARSQAAFNAFFRRMELSLREMGIGDMGVPRHMKRMMTGYNGRIRAYWDAVDRADSGALISALKRNVYGTTPDTLPEKVENLAGLVLERSGGTGEKHGFATAE